MGDRVLLVSVLMTPRLNPYGHRHLHSLGYVSLSSQIGTSEPAIDVIGPLTSETVACP
jgi:hypothetical protein